MTQEVDEERRNMVVIDVMSMLGFTLAVCLGRYCCSSVAIAEKSGVCGRVENVGKSDIVSFDRGVWVSASACIDSVEVHGQGKTLDVWFDDEVSKVNRTAY